MQAPRFFLPLLLLAAIMANGEPAGPAANGNPARPAAKPNPNENGKTPDDATDVPPPAPSTAVPVDVRASVVRINSTQQKWNVWQPWEKNPPRRVRALAAIIGPQRVITTAELVADATYLEFESADGTRFAKAAILAADYEANLALLGPASAAEGTAFFANTTPFAVSEPATLGCTLDVVQLEDNGLTLQTAGVLQSIDVTTNFLPGQYFLTYMLKASMQSTSSSYSLPVLHAGKFAGVLLSYNAKDQICGVTATDIVAKFLQRAAGGRYTGFPTLGVAIARTEDASFRRWLKLDDTQGGIYIERVRKGGAADLAGLKPGDVLLAVDGMPIDRRGYYQHPNYGSLSWGHLIRGEKAPGDKAKLSILRAGTAMDLEAVLTREDESARLIPQQLFDRAPNFLVKGGFVFQELSRPVLEGFGEDWENRAPLDLLDAYVHPEKYEADYERIVFLGGVVPTPATIGYERLRNLIVRKVNGKPVRHMKDLIAAFETKDGGLHAIEFLGENLTIHLDEAVSDDVDAELLQRGITRLSRAE